MASLPVPSSISAERALLGSILVDSTLAWANGAGIVSAADFFSPAHGLIYDAMCWLRANGHDVTGPTIAWALAQQGTIARCDELLGQPWTEPYLAGLYERIYSAHATLAFAKIVTEYADRRREIQRGIGIVNRALRQPIDSWLSQYEGRDDGH